MIDVGATVVVVICIAFIGVIWFDMIREVYRGWKQN